MKRALNSAMPVLVSAAALAHPEDVYGSVDREQTFTLGSLLQSVTTNVAAPVIAVVDLVARRLYASPAASANASANAYGDAAGTVAAAFPGPASARLTPVPNASGTYSRSTLWTSSVRTTQVGHDSPGLVGVEDILDPIQPTFTLGSLINRIDANNVAAGLVVSQNGGYIDVYVGLLDSAAVSMNAFKSAALGGNNADALVYDVPAGATGTVAALPFE